MHEDGFFAWALKGLQGDGIGAWAAKNIDTLSWCFAFGFGMTAIGAFLRKSDSRTLLYGFLATFILIGSLIWIADDYGIRKVFWPLISMGIGGASLIMIGGYLRFMTKVEARLPDIAADGVSAKLKAIIGGSTGIAPDTDNSDGKN